MLIRRSISQPDELAFYLTHATDGTALAYLVQVAGTRWAVEACFEAAKGEVGLDQYEVRSSRLARQRHAPIRPCRAVARIAVEGSARSTNWRPTLFPRHLHLVYPSRNVDQIARPLAVGLSAS